MSLPEWFNCQTILWVHHKISSKVVKHDSIGSTVELQQHRKETTIKSQDKQIVADFGKKFKQCMNLFNLYVMSDSYSLQLFNFYQQAP